MGQDYDLLDTDYFLWDIVMPLAEANENITTVALEGTSDEVDISIHDEIKNKIVEIGNLLGFESKSEVKVATGAVVDAVWQFQIGNMGKIMYVFEVHSKGSIDSLMMNLVKAQVHPEVQAIVAVSNEEQLVKIKNESEGIDLVEKNLRLWDFNDVIAVHASLVKAHESINKLKLVPDSFMN